MPFVSDTILFVKENNAAVKLMRTRIRLLAQPKSMRSIIDATQRHIKKPSSEETFSNNPEGPI